MAQNKVGWSGKIPQILKENSPAAPGIMARGSISTLDTWVCETPRA